MIHKAIRRIQRFKGWFGGGAAALCIFAGLYIGLIESPPDYYQGEVVRIMYVHVPLAHTALFAYTVLFGRQCLVSLETGPHRGQYVPCLCHALSAVFTALALGTGMIWGKPTWNTWWTWDARLTSFISPTTDPDWVSDATHLY